MEYFENKRAAADRDKVTTMYNGLNTFVTGSNKRRKLKSEADERARSGKNARSETYGLQVERTDGRSETEMEYTPSLDYAETCHATPRKDTLEDRSSDMPLGEQYQATLTRAANLLAESLGLNSGGVVFYDPVTVIGLVAESKSESFSPLNECSQMVWGDGVVESESARAKVIAEKRTGNLQSLSPAPDLPKMTTRILAGLIEHYPSGHIWEFDDHGLLPVHERPRPLSDVTGNEASDTDEGRYLSRLFPGVRSLIFVPLFDANAGTHYTGCFAWSTDSTNRFNPDVEFSFVKAFGNNVSAEIQQLTTLDADRAKSDFISSISHELRTPLHGMWNAYEYLKATRMTSAQYSHLSTIGNATKTLLDTITHVLDFSKINKSSRRASKAVNIDTSLDQQPQDTGMLKPPVDLAAITEQVVDSINASTMSKEALLSLESVSPTGHAQMKNNVHVFLDIAVGNWLFRTEAGAIGRVVMNIFGNALKYTDKGSVTVRLLQTNDEQSTQRAAEGGRTVVLVVTDTGRGISPHYLKHGLFEPFTQESKLNEGTGLGMSIVLKTVKELHGDVIVNSTKGGGTEVRVILPNLISASRTDLADSSPDALHYLQSLPGPLIVGLYGFDPDDQISKLLQQYLHDWIHAKCVSDWTRNQQPHAIIVDELLLSGMMQDLRQPDVEVIVLCHNPGNFQKLQNPNGRYHFLLKTFGPLRLAAAIRECIEGFHASDPTTSDSQSQSDLSADSAPETEATLPALLTPGDSESPTGSTENTSQTRTADPVQPSSSRRPERPKLATIGTSKISSESSLPDATSSSGTRPPRVLVVDDNITNRKLIAAHLRKKRMSVDEAVNGYLAVQAAMAADYDFIIMDINMPVMDGQQATREIRKCEARMGKKRLRMSSNGHDERIAAQPWDHAPDLPDTDPFDLADLASPPDSPEDAVMTDVEDDDDEEEVVTPTISIRPNAAVIVASTAQNDPANREAGLTNGFDVWLTKPYRTKGLIPMITTWMKDRIMDLSALENP